MPSKGSASLPPPSPTSRALATFASIAAALAGLISTHDTVILLSLLPPQASIQGAHLLLTGDLIGLTLTVIFLFALHHAPSQLDNNSAGGVMARDAARILLICASVPQIAGALICLLWDATAPSARGGGDGDDDDRTGWLNRRTGVWMTMPGILWGLAAGIILLDERRAQQQQQQQRVILHANPMMEPMIVVDPNTVVELLL